MCEWQIRLCEELDKLFYDTPTYIWAHLQSLSDEWAYWSEYDVLASFLTRKPSKFKPGSTHFISPVISANEWKGIYDMCKSSRYASESRALDLV